QHVPHEPLVARNIDQGQAMGSQRQRSEPQVDRDPTLFFGWQTIGVDSCQGADQSCLAVVDMPRRSQDSLAACHRRLAKSSIRPPLDEVSLAVLSGPGDGRRSVQRKASFSPAGERKPADAIGPKVQELQHWVVPSQVVNDDAVRMY